MDQDNNNNSTNTPSTSSDVMPSGGSTIGQAATQGTKKAARKGWNGFKDAVGRGIRAIWSFMPMTVKIVVLVVIVIFIIIAALLMMGMVSESTQVASNNVNNYMMDSADLDEEAKALYEEKSSLMKLKLSDINAIYDKFVNEDNGGAETQTLMQYQIGTNDVAEENIANRIINIDDKLPLYKHILLTEKYNFNEIDWIKYSHSSGALGKKVETFKEDKELGVKYPDTSLNEDGSAAKKIIELKDFIDLTLPYLQTWYIPLSMSNASVVNGTEEDSSRSPSFSYNIIKEAYNDIVVNWYELKKHTLVTSYDTYTENTCQDLLENISVIESKKYRYNDKTKKYEYDHSEYSIDVSKVKSQKTVNKTRYIDKSTDTGLKGGKKAPLKEDHVNSYSEFSSSAYIKRADVFDAKILNEFNHTVYSDSDVLKRINPKSKSETPESFAKTTERPWNNSENAVSNISCDGTGNLVFSNGTEAEYTNSTGTKNLNFDSTIGETTRFEHTYTVKLKDYVEYEDELKWTVTRIWQDELTQKGSEVTDYKIDDVIKYNESNDRKVKVSATELCGSSFASGSSSSGSSSGSSATNSPTTEIKINSKTFPVFDQNDYTTTTTAGGSTIAEAGCGLCSMTTVISAMNGSTLDPLNVGNDIGWQGPLLLSRTAEILRDKYGLDATSTSWSTGCKGNTSEINSRKSKSKTDIEASLNAGNPVIIQVKGNWPDLGTTSAHYIVLCGIENGKVVMANSAGGYRGEATLDYILTAMYDDAESDNGYVIVKGKDGSTTSSSSTTTTTLTPGEAKDTPSDANTTGYSGIHKSGITGRSFKIYQQGSALWGSVIYQGGGTIASVGCGLTSDAILCSGYGHDITPKEINSKYSGYSVGNEMDNEVNGGTISHETTSFTVESMKKHLLSGGTLIAFTDRIGKYTSYQHYMAVIDIKSDGSKVYVADPAGAVTGWEDTTEFFNAMTTVMLYGKEGGTGIYEGSTDGSTSGTSSTCDSQSGQYYNILMKTDGLNRIDFMNSNPDIFHRYIREGAEYYKYVGYSRSKLSLSYWNLKDILNKVAEKNDGTLPWAYGKTLGFDNIYTAKEISNSSSGGNGRFIWPVPEYVQAGLGLYEQLTSTFGTRTNPITGAAGQNHSGIDIAAGVNTSAKIVAAASGTVMKASDSGDGYGQCVIIQHTDGYYTLYGHMVSGSIKVNVGDKVNSGQVIGTMGTTGNSTGNHLHFEVIKFDGDFSMEKIYGPGHVNCLDPVNFFNEDCSPIGGGATSQNLIDFLWEIEGSDEYLNSQGYLTDDNKYYIIYTVNGNRTVGHGIDLDAGGYDTVLSNAGYPTSVGSKVPKEFVDELSRNDANSRRNQIVSKVSGLNLKEYQIDALVARSYQMGSTGWYDGNTWSYAPGLTFNSAYQKWWKESDTKSTPDFNHPLYINFMQYTKDGGIWRREAEWRLFQTGVYDASH